VNCRDARKYLSAFLDDELDVRTNIEILEHVGICPECARCLEEQRLLKESVARYIGSVRAPEHLRARIADALSSVGSRRRVDAALLREAVKSGWFRIAAAAASILVVFGLVYGLLLSPTAGLGFDAMNKHIAVLRDEVPAWVYTRDRERALRLALFRFHSKPAIPLLSDEQFELVGAGPAEMESRDVGHFCFRYGGVTVSMFVFEGLPLTEIGGAERETRLGVVKVDHRGEMSLVGWRTGSFTYVMVGRLSEEDFLKVLGTSIDRH